MIQASGSYTGNGTTQNVTGLGAAADFVLVKGGTNKASIWTSTMAAASFRPATGAVALVTANGITQHASGFTVGSDAGVNANGTVYRWVAFNDNGAGDCHAGSYSGNITARSITGVGFQPSVLIIVPGGTRALQWATDTMTTGNACQWASSTATGRVTTLDAAGFTLSTSSEINANAETFHYFCLKNTANLVKTMTYPGNGTTNHAITGAGFAPDNVVMKIQSTSTTAGYRGGGQTGDACYGMDASNTGTARVLSMDSDGMTLGTSSITNTNAANYDTLFLKDGTSLAPVSTFTGDAMSLLGVS